MANNSDQVDWSLLKPSKKPNNNKKDETDNNTALIPDTTTPILNPNSEFYELGNGLKGKALIFNHYTFDFGFSNREGTDKDGKDLQRQLEALNFDVEVHRDLKYGELFDVLNTTSKSDLSGYSCVLVAVMSHGEKNKIQARDHGYTPDTLWTPFCGSRCIQLVGKPKIVLIQACRGDKVDAGAKYKRTGTDSNTPNEFKIPNYADLLVMYSTYEDHFSFRSPANGSWFVQSVVKELEERGNDEDFLSILTCVNRTMAFNYESFVATIKELNEKKQIGTIMSTLTKKFYLRAREDKKEN